MSNKPKSTPEKKQAWSRYHAIHVQGIFLGMTSTYWAWLNCFKIGCYVCTLTLWNPRIDKLCNLTIQKLLDLCFQQKVCDYFVSLSLSSYTDCLSRIRMVLSRSDPNSTCRFTSSTTLTHKFQNFQR